jgi:hypothetical protein
VSKILSNQGSARGGFGAAADTVSGNGNTATVSTNANNETVGGYNPMSGLGDAIQ